MFIMGKKKSGTGAQRSKAEEDALKYSDLGGLNFNPKKLKAKGAKGGKKSGK
jgi:hypothetical protein